MRYTKLREIIDEMGAKNILEVGTHNGKRAVEMCKGIKDHTYYGFDIFEKGNPQLHIDEYNGKAKRQRDYVSVRLDLAKQGIEAVLFEGLTRDTLPGALDKLGPGSIDFAFIDGGHSFETVENDWKYVKHLVRDNGIVVFDDVYLNMTHAGAQRTVKRLPHEIIAADGQIQLAKVVMNDSSIRGL